MDPFAPNTLPVLTGISDKVSTEATLIQVLNALTGLSLLLGQTDTLETLGGTTNTLLTTLNSYNDGIETLLTNVNTNVDGVEGLLSALGVKDDNVLSKLETLRVALTGTLAVSASSLPLPAGAATQTTLAALLTAIQGTLAISASALPLPAGAATSALQNTLNTTLGTLATQATAAAVLSALQGTLSVTRAAQAVSVDTLTFGAGASLSSSVNFSGRLIVGMGTGATWTAADLTVQRSFDSGTTWIDVYDDFNNVTTVKFAASRFATLSAPIIGAGLMRLRSGTPVTPVAQVSATSLSVVSQNA